MQNTNRCSGTRAEAMPCYLGLTWEHPRGKNALIAAADRERAASTLDIRWETHPLEGFEERPIGELAQHYDLIVLDHPHLGEAIASWALTPMDAFIAPDGLANWDRRSIGQSFASYSAYGRQWAVPLDAAAQVAAYRPELIRVPPRTWAEVHALALVAPVALSLAGPHALLTFASIRSALAGSAPRAATDLVGGSGGREALELMRAIASKADRAFTHLNPIAMLETMRDTKAIAYCPLIYGYVNYSGHGVRFTNIPKSQESGPDPGSVLGGTGLALTSRCEPSQELLDHIEWLMSDEAQRDFIPRHDGQPSARSAWLDPHVDAQADGFYSSTLATLEASWLRPRGPGYICFQTAASAAVRDVVLGELDLQAGLERLSDLAEAANRTQEPTA